MGASTESGGDGLRLPHLNPHEAEILTALQEGDLSLTGQFMQSSNYTFLAQVKYQQQKLQAVYKPQKGEQPLWDFPAGTLCKREVTAYVVSEGLGWELVPPTVFRRKAPLGRGSLQLYIEHDPEQHYFSFDADTRARLQTVAVFDLIINNADRKGGHILLDDSDHLWLVDHGICFHQEYKLRTVVWDFAGQPIHAQIICDLQELSVALEKGSDLYQGLRRWISHIEIGALQVRTRSLLQMGMYPFPDEKRLPYPWPPL